MTAHVITQRATPDSSWNSTASTGAPSAQRSTALATGTETIVWGRGNYQQWRTILNCFNALGNRWSRQRETTISQPKLSMQKLKAGGRDKLAKRGHCLFNVPTGTRTITFNKLAGWITPSNQTLTVALNQTNTVTATYIQLQPPVFQSVTSTNQTFTLTWSAMTNQNYQLQYSTDLSSTNWTNLGSLTNAKSGAITLIDPTATNTERFCRGGVNGT